MKALKFVNVTHLLLTTKQTKLVDVCLQEFTLLIMIHACVIDLFLPQIVSVILLLLTTKQTILVDVSLHSHITLIPNIANANYH